jgi:hypothetical protein
MSAALIPQNAEGANWLVTLRQRSFQRTTIATVVSMIDTNRQENMAEWEERRTDPTRCWTYTERQMLRHRRVIATAARYTFVRELPLFVQYMECGFALRMEDKRFEHHPDPDDKEIWWPEVEQLLKPAPRPEPVPEPEPRPEPVPDPESFTLRDLSKYLGVCLFKLFSLWLCSWVVKETWGLLKSTTRVLEYAMSIMFAVRTALDAWLRVSQRCSRRPQE